MLLGLGFLGTGWRTWGPHLCKVPVVLWGADMVSGGSRKGIWLPDTHHCAPVAQLLFSLRLSGLMPGGGVALKS